MDAFIVNMISEYRLGEGQVNDQMRLQITVDDSGNIFWWVIFKFLDHIRTITLVMTGGIVYVHLKYDPNGQVLWAKHLGGR